MTPLDKTLKRALKIKSRDYVITLAPDSLKITEKGRRIGVQLNWQALISGDAALAMALQASIGKFKSDTRAAPDNTAKAARSETSKRKVRARPRKTKRS